MIDYNQGDKSWGDIPYPKKPYTLATSGCGPTTVANLVRYITGKKVTPKDTGIYMRQHGYAIMGQGTLWAGMPLTLNHYGLVDKEYSTVIGSFDAFKKYKTGYILFSKGTKGGITWTTNGHYVAIEDYKEEKGKHYFYTCDSGNRDNDGWHCYETQMYGLAEQIHVVYKKSTEPKKPVKKKTLKKGFDISYAQNGLSKTSFNKAKKAGWEFVIIRIGTILKGKLYTDKEFESKYKNAKEAGLIVGAYWYGMATDTKTAKKEAEYCIEQLKGKTLDYPVFYDFEDKCQSNLGKKKSKQIIDTFCKTIEKAGYKAGVYASYSWLTNKIDPIEDYYVWLAQYPKATYKGRYEMHQYSSVGKVDGIGNIDVDTSEIPIIKTVTKEKTVPEKAAEWAIKTAKDNSFAYGKGGPKDWYHGRCRARQVGCYYCGTTVSGPKKAKKGSKWEKTYCCNSFVMAAYVHGGGLFSKCKNGSTKIDYWLNLKKDGKTLFELSKNPTVKTLKVGDILCNGKHVKLYVGNGKVAHAKRQGWDSGSITVETIKKIGDYKVARYKGPTTI